VAGNVRNPDCDSDPVLSAFEDEELVVIQDGRTILPGLDPARGSYTAFGLDSIEKFDQIVVLPNLEPASDFVPAAGTASQRTSETSPRRVSNSLVVGIEPAGPKEKRESIGVADFPAAAQHEAVAVASNTEEGVVAVDGPEPAERNLDRPAGQRARRAGERHLLNLFRPDRLQEAGLSVG
jgi:hypothetical protein